MSERRSRALEERSSLKNRRLPDLRWNKHGSDQDLEDLYGHPFAWLSRLRTQLSLAPGCCCYSLFLPKAQLHSPI